jgi:hypothetical protein
MFYREEDIQPVVDIIERTLGPQGIMMSGKNISKNVTVGSPQFGKLWYGDVDGDMDYVQSLCDILSQRTSQNISVVPETY